jgi:excisionase family DNA binding protein
VEIAMSTAESHPESLPPTDPRDERDRYDELDPREWAVIDQALQVVYADHLRVATQLRSPTPFEPIDPATLRQGPLGQDLVFLARAARGKAGAPTERVLTAIESVVQVLFWPAADDDYRVPRAFWATELGQMLALAKFSAFAPAQLLAIGAAARRLGVARPTIYRWIDDRTLDAVRDRLSGRTYVVRRGVDAMAQVARELAAPN